LSIYLSRHVRLTQCYRQTIDLDETTLDIIKGLSRIPAAARAWRPTVADAFNDIRFFNCSPEAAQRWRPLLRALVDTDKTVFPDLLGRLSYGNEWTLYLSSTAKITTGPSANIFTNREHDNMIRSLNLRRLSFVLFIGERNHFLAQLPSIQEKLVEILKNPPGAVVQSEVRTTHRCILKMHSNSYQGLSLHAGFDVSTVTSQFIKLLADHFDRTRMYASVRLMLS